MQSETVVLSQELARVANCLSGIRIENTTDRLAKALQIEAFAKLYQLINDISWHEHTSDWDTFVLVVFDDETSQRIDAVDSIRLDPSVDTLCIDSDKVTHVIFDTVPNDKIVPIRIDIDKIHSLVLDW